jgi:hypothetical protein
LLADAGFKKSHPTMAGDAAFSLTTRGLSHVPMRESSGDFSFIVGGSTYRCPSLIAEFLSPRIAKLRSVDETITNFRIKTRDKGGHFSEFVSLGRREPLLLNESNRSFHLSVSKELGNSELYLFIEGGRGDTLSIENVVQRLKRRAEIGLKYDHEVQFAASHFFDPPFSDLSQLSCDVLSAVLCDPGLTIESEDSVFELILNRVSGNVRYFGLFDLIRFEFLSAGSFDTYVDVVAELFDHFTVAHWKSLPSRLVLPVSPLGTQMIVPQLNGGRFAVSRHRPAHFPASLLI